jgi:cytochrome c oxidase subunit IV
MVMKLGSPHGSRVYWVTWGALLALTVVMFLVDGLSMPRLAFLAFVLSAMLAKASLIGAHFMHLRFERRPLALMVLVGLLLTGTVLFVLIAPDAVRIAAMNHR